MNEYENHWQKLVALARQASDDRDVAVPPGFAPRMAARAVFVSTGGSWGLLEHLALRGLLAAAACCAAAIAFNYWGSGADSTEDVAVDDSVMALLDLS